jgi:hypothetical protein
LQALLAVAPSRAFTCGGVGAKGDLFGGGGHMGGCDWSSTRFKGR